MKLQREQTNAKRQKDKVKDLEEKLMESEKQNIFKENELDRLHQKHQDQSELLKEQKEKAIQEIQQNQQLQELNQKLNTQNQQLLNKLEFYDQ